MPCRTILISPLNEPYFLLILQINPNFQHHLNYRLFQDDDVELAAQAYEDPAVAAAI